MIETSELIINADGSCFHLHVRPDQLADKVIMCGDPGRVDMIASFFDSLTFVCLLSDPDAAALCSLPQ